MIKSFSNLKTSKQLKQKSTRRLRKQQTRTHTLIQNASLLKFKKFITKQHADFLNSKLSEYYGKNFPINYKSSYGFGEQWQGLLHNQLQKQKQSVFQNESPVLTAVLFVIMVFNTITIWTNTIQTFFMERSQTFMSPQLFILGMLLELLHFTIKIILTKTQEVETSKMFIYSRLSYKNILVFSYYLLKYLRSDEIMNIWWWYGVEAISIYLMYKRASKIYSSFKLNSIALIYELELKIVDIITNISIIAHFIAIILYQSTKLRFQTTWISQAGIEGENFFVKYIYSFYFCCTTILTVGYGDICPQNYAEVIIVTLVQIFGIIVFGYFISEIGYCLSTMRKASESVEKDLLVIEKIKKWYKLDDGLTKRARSHIINHKSIDSQLSPEQQNRLMVKLSDDLRKQIRAQNALKIVKSSVYFLLRWSTSFQNAVSLRLSNIIFPPGQLLYQPLGKQRIYIIREGKIDIYASKRGAKRGSNTTVLKTIQNNLRNDVCNNTYGYTAVISRRPVQLYAVAKQNTTGYYIQKQKFIQCINERTSDLEYFHQIKNKLDLQLCWESIQVPRLNNSKHHYNPTHTLIIRRNKKEESYQQRNSWARNRRRVSCAVNHDKLAEFVRRFQNSCIELQKTESIIEEGRLKVDQTQHCKNYFHHFFQSSKEYQNYFVRNNRSRVLKSLQIQLGMSQREWQIVSKNSLKMDS